MESLEKILTSVGLVGSGSASDFRLLCRRERILLALPKENSNSIRAWELYAPQRLAARLAVFFLKRLPWLPSERVKWREESLLARFLHPEGKPSPFLVGNSGNRGRRLIFLVSGLELDSLAVAKVGGTEEAGRLIRQERAFLKMLDQHGEKFFQKEADPFVCVPKVLAEFDDGDLTGFKMGWVDAGAYVKKRDAASLPKILEAWMDSSLSMKVCELAEWKDLLAVRANLEKENSFLSDLGKKNVHPSLGHGDLVPWNVRVDESSRVWWILDWERGQAQAVPGMDWLHWHVQQWILVERLSWEKLLAAVRELLEEKRFLRYLEKAGLAGQGRVLLRFYLLHQIYVIQPAEGKKILEELLAWVQGGEQR
jgi:hypothetical protein